jgi:hypothetical protein
MASAPAAPGEAQEQAAPSPAGPAQVRLAGEIAQIAASGDMMMTAVLSGWDQGMKEEKATMAELDTLSPGLAKAIAERGKAELTAMVKERLPALQNAVAGIYVANADEEELQSVLTFLRSPTGAQFVCSVMLSDAGDSADIDDGEISTAELKKANRQASMEALRGMNAQQKVELIRFGASPGGRVMKAIGEEIQPALATWLTSLMQDYEKRVEPVIEKIVVDALDKQAAQ